MEIARLLLIIVAFIQVCFLPIVFGAEDTLKLVHLVWRHGNRSPNYGTFPTDTKNRAWTWHNGFAELTKTGLREQFDFGEFLRQRYIDTGFLSSKPNLDEIYIRTMDVDRTLQSALAFLGGMYPPVREGKSKSTRDCWQLIPVHTVPREIDSLLNFYGPCPEYARLLEERMNSKDARRFMDENKEFIKFLERKTGLNVTGPREIQFIHDPLRAEFLHGEDHKWPSWVTMKIYIKIADLFQESLKYYFSPEILRLRGSELLFEIASRNFNMTKKASPIRFYGYCSQDIVIVALLKLFGAFNGYMPDLSTGLIFELHEIRGENFVKVLYKNETNSNNLDPVTINGCHTPNGCPLDKFVQLARDVTPKDWRQACRFPDVVEGPNKINRLKAAIKGLAVLTGIFIVLFVATLIWFLR